jgi:Fe-S-cluster containining protein
MELKVLKTDPSTPGQAEPWYAKGLQFTCSQCGNCCTGPTGYVWISKEEIQRLATHLKLTPGQVINQYCRRVSGKYSLKEHRNERGEYDCIFLKEEKVDTGNGDHVVHTKRICTIYPVRPLQCRTWPFWSENLRNIDIWNRSGVRCHGINHGSRVFTKEQIEALRDAKDWPQNPPTSG